MWKLSKINRVMNLGWVLRTREEPSQARSAAGTTRPSRTRDGQRLPMKTLKGERSMKLRVMDRSRNCYWIFKLTVRSFHKVKDLWPSLITFRRCARELSMKASLHSELSPLEAVFPCLKNQLRKWLRASQGKFRRFLEPKEIKLFWLTSSIKHQLLRIPLSSRVVRLH